MNDFFKTITTEKKSRARAGILKTPHGEIQTPAFVPVGTQGTVKSQTPDDLNTIGVQIFFVNTYHLFLRPGEETVKKMGGLHKFIGWNKPLMTDSGGFQIFSLAREKFQVSNPPVGEREVKFQSRESNRPQLVKIDDGGVTFRSHLDGSLQRFTPEISIEVQQKLGADIILAFDQCPPHRVRKDQVEKATERTHDWALRSLKAAKRRTNKRAKQALFGIVQGGVFQDLREESAKFISHLNPSGAEGFDGLAIGGVAVGESKQEMYQVLDWVMPYLPDEKPRHLLGVGEVDDIFEAVERGVDMFDCVMPTRLGRMGHVLTNEKSLTAKEKWTLDITKSIFSDDPQPIVKECKCYTCQNFSRAYLNHLFRARELLAYRLATYHNLWFMIDLVKQIRKAIIEHRFIELKEDWLKRIDKIH